ncbi:MAG: bifunctional precorrin-2 dehydrogenase/sirohydrochlorin ferrochelatase [Deltaproteobacteria bacterium]|nr:bifunctional precorrin-2 dehydrogenase/sirohydrochlorin ferrochelatase [Deltaproteobacteria bacterium]
MRYYPANLDIQNQNCLVVGGGSVGKRKILTLLECGARVIVVSPKISHEIKALSEGHHIELKERNYRSSDLEGMLLVIGATDNEEVNRQISKDAARSRIICNIVDRPQECTFVLPAIVKQGDLVIAISTAGKSPAFAKSLRRKLSGEFGPEYGKLLDLMGVIRKKLLQKGKSPEAHKYMFEQLIDEGLLKLVKHNNRKQIDTLLKKVLGEGFVLEDLLNTESKE